MDSQWTEMDQRRYSLGEKEHHITCPCNNSDTRGFVGSKLSLTSISKHFIHAYVCMSVPAMRLCLKTPHFTPIVTLLWGNWLVHLSSEGMNLE